MTSHFNLIHLMIEHLIDIMHILVFNQQIGLNYISMKRFMYLANKMKNNANALNWHHISNFRGCGHSIPLLSSLARYVLSGNICKTPHLYITAHFESNELVHHLVETLSYCYTNLAPCYLGIIISQSWEQTSWCLSSNLRRFPSN